MKNLNILLIAIILTAVMAGGNIFAQPAPKTVALNFALPFVPNEGRYEEQVKFTTQLFCGDFFVTTDGLIYCIAGHKNKVSVFRESFLDAEGEVISFSPAPLEKSSAKVSYFIGNDPARWQTGTSTYKTVSLGDVYPGIEARLKADTKNVEKIFYVSPGASFEDIKIKVEGVKGLKISPEGNLILKTEYSSLSLKKPIAYQDINGEKHNIKTAYRKIKRHTYGFQILDDYNSNYPLIIDPALMYSTYLGGVESDVAYDIAIDSSGNAYVTGSTYSRGFPYRNGCDNYGSSPMVFVTKINTNASGDDSLVCSTWLGGQGADYGYSIAVDSLGNAYVTGRTSSRFFPTYREYEKYLGGSRGTPDAFFTKINISSSDVMSLAYSTLLGGSQHEEARGVAVDSSGYAYITGYTMSTNFQTKNAYDTDHNGSSDAFVAKFNPFVSGASSLLYSTYLGGENVEVGYGIAADSSGNAYVGGKTRSSLPGFPTTENAYMKTMAGSYSGFVAKLNTNASGAGSLVYSTYLAGGGAYDQKCSGIAVDSSGHAYVTGETHAFDFPTTATAYDTMLNNVSWDAFVTKIDTNSSGDASLAYSTYLGGGEYDFGYGIDVDSSGCAYVTGYTASNDFPTKDAYQESDSGGNVFVTKIDTNASGAGSLVYSTHLGGRGTEYGRGIAAGSSGNVYVTGNVTSIDFPTTENAYDTTYNRNVSVVRPDAFVTRLEWGAFLRAYDGGKIVGIATEPGGTLTSPLRVYKDSQTYGVELVETDDPDATSIRVQTKDGIKALKRF